MLNANQLSILYGLNCTLEDYYLVKYTKMGKYVECALLPPKPNLVSKGMITKFGWKLLKEIDENAFKNRFNELWDAYPATDAVGGFPATRENVRGSKFTAIEEYNNLLAQGISEQEIIDGTIRNIERLKEDSKFSNQLTYLVGVNRFLKEGKWKVAPIKHEENDAFL